MNAQCNMAVYRLDIDHDDPRVETFVPKDDEGPLLGSRGWDMADRLTDFRPARPIRADWEPPQLSNVWKPLAVKGRIRTWNDYPRLIDLPAFSRRAVDVLRDMLEANGELLPLICDHGDYWAYNLRTIADIVNVDKSVHAFDEATRLRYFPITEIDRFEVYSDRLAALTIFRIRQDATGTYATRPFAERVRAAGLHNFVFNRVWPWPEGTVWRTEAANQRRAAREARRRRGASNLRGNTVVIRLITGGRGKPTKQQHAHVAAIMDSLDALLADPAASYDAPVFGNLEGDEPTTGEHRLFLSCPHADRLVDHLRPWLHHLDWPGAVVVVKRYGELYDGAAREESVRGPW
jgi:hypothetical protein